MGLLVAPRERGLAPGRPSRRRRGLLLPLLLVQEARRLLAPDHPERALVAGAASLGGIAAVQGWRLLAFMGAFMGAAVLAHRYWYRLEDFGEHLAQFHDEE